MAGQNIARWEIQTKIQGEKRETPASARETIGEVTSHEPRGKYRILEIG